MLYVTLSFLHDVLHELKIILVYVFKSESRFRLQGSYLHITSLAITFSKPTVKLLRKKLVNIFLVFLLLIVIKYLSTENALQEFLKIFCQLIGYLLFGESLQNYILIFARTEGQTVRY